MLSGPVLPRMKFYVPVTYPARSTWLKVRMLTSHRAPSAFHLQCMIYPMHKPPLLLQLAICSQGAVIKCQKSSNKSEHSLTERQMWESDSDWASCANSVGSRVRNQCKPENRNYLDGCLNRHHDDMHGIRLLMPGGVYTVPPYPTPLHLSPNGRLLPPQRSPVSL